MIQVIQRACPGLPSCVRVVRESGTITFEINDHLGESGQGSFSLNMSTYSFYFIAVFKIRSCAVQSASLD